MKFLELLSRINDNALAMQETRWGRDKGDKCQHLIDSCVQNRRRFENFLDVHLCVEQPSVHGQPHHLHHLAGGCLLYKQRHTLQKKFRNVCDYADS